MSARDDGGPAFPVLELNPTTGDVCDQHMGMTMRDYLAAHAPDAPETWHGGERSISDVIAWRYYYADAMLKERAK